MPRALPAMTALALVIAAGLVHGRWTQRWGASRAVEDAAAGLGRVPLTLGDWRGRPVELDRRQAAGAGVAGYVARRYEHRRSRAAVTVLLVCGRPGPIAVHTPDVCYAGAGYELLGPPARQAVPAGPSGRPAAFWHGRFGKRHPVAPTYLRILWGWSAAGGWEAPDNPRLTFAPRPALYKLYVIREMATAGEPLEGDPCLDFLGALLPALERTLFVDPRAEGQGAAPRNERPEFGRQLERALPCYRDRLLVRPGITGLAQVQLPRDVDLNSIRRKPACDLWYVRRMGPGLDLRILLSTAPGLLCDPSARACRLLRFPGGPTVEAASNLLAQSASVPPVRPS